MLDVSESVFAFVIEFLADAGDVLYGIWEFVTQRPSNAGGR